MKKLKLNVKRRKFLKFAFFGAVTFLLGGVITRLSGIGEREDKNALPLRKFRVLEKDSGLVFYNREGHKLFTVSDDGDLEIG